MYEQLKIKNCTYKEVTREEYLCISFTLGLSVSWICSDKKNKHMKQIVTLFFQNSWRQNVNLFDWFILIILTVILYTGDTNIAFYQVFWTKKNEENEWFCHLSRLSRVKTLVVANAYYLYLSKRFKSLVKCFNFQNKKKNTCIMIKSVFIETMYTYF